MRRILALLLALTAWPIAALAQSMTADTAYVRAVSYMQGEFSKLRADQAEKDAQLLSALSEIRRLKEEAASRNGDVASRALTALAGGDSAAAVDALLAQAQASARANDTWSAASQYRRAGAVAFAADSTRAIAAYQGALVARSDDMESAGQLALLYLRVGKLDDALAMALNLKASANPVDKVMGQMAEARVARARGDLARADALQAEAGAAAKALNLGSLEAQSLNERGFNSKLGGNYEDAQARYLQALSISLTIDDKAGQAAAYSNLGALASVRNANDEAESYLKRALALNVELGRKLAQGTNLGNLGLIAYKRSDYAAAESSYKSALAVFTEANAKEARAGVLGNLADVADAKGDNAGAEAYQKQAMALHIELGQTAAQADDLRKLSFTAQKRGDRTGAKAYLEQALAIHKQRRAQAGQAQILTDLGNLAKAGGDVAESCRLHRESLAFFDGGGGGAAMNAPMVQAAPRPQRTLPDYCRS